MKECPNCHIAPSVDGSCEKCGWSPPPSAGSALFVPLKRQYFEAFARGEKKEEYRPYGPRWNERTCYIGRPVVLSLGYGKHRRLTGRIVSFDRSGGQTKTRAWQDCYGGKGYTVAACIGVELDAPNIVLSNQESHK